MLYLVAGTLLRASPFEMRKSYMVSLRRPNRNRSTRLTHSCCGVESPPGSRSAMPHIARSSASAALADSPCAPNPFRVPVWEYSSPLSWYACAVPLVARPFSKLTCRTAMLGVGGRIRGVLKINSEAQGLDSRCALLWNPSEGFQRTEMQHLPDRGLND